MKGVVEMVVAEVGAAGSGAGLTPEKKKGRRVKHVARRRPYGKLKSKSADQGDIEATPMETESAAEPVAYQTEVGQVSDPEENPVNDEGTGESDPVSNEADEGKDIDEEGDEPAAMETEEQSEEDGADDPADDDFEPDVSRESDQTPVADKGAVATKDAGKKVQQFESVAARLSLRKSKVESVRPTRGASKPADKSVSELIKESKRVRAAAAEGESDSDADVVVAKVSKQTKAADAGGASKSARKGKGVKVSASGVYEQGVWFSSKKVSNRWSKIQGRTVVREGAILLKKFEVPEVIQMITDAGLMQTVSQAKPFSEQLVREFVGNVTEEFGDVHGRNYGMVMVRGHKVVLSPEDFNSYFGIEEFEEVSRVGDWDALAKAMTSGQLTEWSKNTIESTYLSTKYALLHGVCIRNWIPVLHRNTMSRHMGAFIWHVSQGKKVNLGQIAFQQIAGHATSNANHYPIAYPSALFEIITSKCPALKEERLIMSQEPKELIADWKVFVGKHEIDCTVPERVKKIIESKGIRTGHVGETSLSGLKGLMMDRLKQQLILLEQSEIQIQTEKKEIKGLLKALEAASEGDDSDADADGGASSDAEESV